MKLNKIYILLLTSFIFVGCSYKTTSQKIEEIDQKYPNSEFHQIPIEGSRIDDNWLVCTTNNSIFFVYFNYKNDLTSIPVFHNK